MPRSWSKRSRRSDTGQATRRTALELGKSLDLLLCAGSLLVALYLLNRPLWQGQQILLVHPIRQILSAVVLAFAWHCCLVSSGCYRSYRLARFEEQAIAIGRAAALTSLCTLVWAYFEGARAAPRFLPPVSGCIVFGVTCFGALLFARLAARIVTHALRRRGRNLRHVLIVGSNQRAVSIADNLRQERALGYNLVGFVDDRWHFDGAPDSYKRMLIGTPDDVLDLLRRLPLDEVILSLPIASKYHVFERVTDWCAQQGIVVRCDARLFRDSTHATTAGPAQPYLITLHENSHNEWFLGAKRTLDIVISFLILIASAPVLGLVALAIATTSSGPVIFSQERVGLGKRRFQIYKFRTMVVDAESMQAALEHLNHASGPAFKVRRDPRVTRVGSFLRKSSLDELPQLVNVLLGDMSLVGPRPLPMRDYKGFSVDGHRRRFSVKPGITGLWQISGRSEITFDHWMKLDMDYIDQWSLWLDAKILLQTIPAVLRGAGAM